MRRRCSFRSACVTTRPHGAPRSTPLRTSQTSCHGLHRSCQRGGRPRPWLECSVLCCVPGAVSPRDGGSPPPREADAISPTASRGPQGTRTGEPCPAVGEESRGVREHSASGSQNTSSRGTHRGPRPGGCHRLCKSEPPSAGLCSQGPDFTPEMGSPHHRRGVPADRQT